MNAISLQDDFDSLRPLCYPGTDVFLLCFSVVCPTSFHNVTDKWLPEISAHCPGTPIILVGTQSDLRNDVTMLVELASYNERPVTETDAKHKVKEIGAHSYVECSALTQKNLKDVFDSAIVVALNRGVGRHGKVGKKKGKLGGRRDGKQGSEHSSSKKGWKRMCCFT